jgi:hypothetical protein
MGVLAARRAPHDRWRRGAIVDSTYHFTIHSLDGRVRLTRFTDISLRALMYVGAHEGRAVSAAEMSRRLRVSKDHLLATGRFNGNPVEAHLRVPGISPEHFDRWIELFHRTAHDVLRPHHAVDIVGRAERVRIVLERFACPEAARN